MSRYPSDIMTTARDVERAFWEQTRGQGTELTIADLVSVVLSIERKKVIASINKANDKWLPIETAPKDRSWVLVWYGPDQEHGIATWANGFWVDSDGDEYSPVPHWQPLPEPPTGDEL